MNRLPAERRSTDLLQKDAGRWRLLRLLLVDSARDLFRYKSFFLLIFVLILVDRFLKKTVRPGHAPLRLPDVHNTGLHAARTVFEELPGTLLSLVTDYRTFVALAGLFLLKQLISMWPSSDMRRMHRMERSGFGLVGSLTALKLRQVAWDAFAVGSICTAAGIWSAAAFVPCRMLWKATAAPWPLLILAALIGAFLPVAMAGFSFSSKLAVLYRGGFGDKTVLFFRLFTDLRFLIRSWLFFLVRIGIESVFVVAVPAAVLLTVDTYWLRILAAGLLATPVYSYLKMATFKFFLSIYGDTHLVREEYAAYYCAAEGGQVKN